MTETDATDLVLAAGETATNAIKHASSGVCNLRTLEDRLTLRVSDAGEGIRPEHLPSALFRAGFSTKVSLGMGYTLMLALVDRIWLATGPTGTTVQLEKWLRPQEHEQEALLAALARF